MSRGRRSSVESTPGILGSVMRDRTVEPDSAVDGLS